MTLLSNLVKYNINNNLTYIVKKLTLFACFHDHDQQDVHNWLDEINIDSLNLTLKNVDKFNSIYSQCILTVLSAMRAHKRNRHLYDISQTYILEINDITFDNIKKYLESHFKYDRIEREYNRQHPENLPNYYWYKNEESHIGSLIYNHSHRDYDLCTMRDIYMMFKKYNISYPFHAEPYKLLAFNHYILKSDFDSIYLQQLLTELYHIIKWLHEYNKTVTYFKENHPKSIYLYNIVQQWYLEDA